MRDKHELDRAIQSFDTAIKLNSAYAAAYYNRGSALEFKRDYDRAIADFDQAIKLKPDNAAAFYDRALSRLCRIWRYRDYKTRWHSCR